MTLESSWLSLMKSQRPTYELVSPERWARERPFSGRVVDPRAIPPPRFSDEGWPEDFRMPLLVLGVGGA